MAFTTLTLSHQKVLCMKAETAFSDYIVFVDESGDHGLVSIDLNYPIFVLALCIFRKQDYVDIVCPMLQRLKLKYWGHDAVVMHEHDIRKPSGDFEFLDDLNQLVDYSPFQCIAPVIDKYALKRSGTLAANPYHLSLTLGLERLYAFLETRGEAEKTTHVIVERRGKREDAELELEFRRICAGANSMRHRLNMQLVMSSKESNAAGMQIADLVARPVGIHALRPLQKNRAFDVLQNKLVTLGS
jgi:Protein of unknown function (DUF3800)